MSQLTSTMSEIQEDVRQLSANIQAKDKVDKALKELIEDQTRKQLTFRQLLITLGAFLVTFGGLLLGIVEAFKH